MEDVEVDEHERVSMIGINLGVASPQNNFSKYLKGTPFTYGLSYYHQVKPAGPSFLGIEICNQNFQSFSAALLIDSLFEAEGTTSNGMASLRFNYRHYIPLNLSILDFFVEGSIGFNWLYTSTSITEIGAEDGSTTFDKSDITNFYGAALGLHFPIAVNSYIQARVGYYPGLSAEYYSRLEEDIIPVNTTLVAFKLRQTVTDILRFELGYTHTF